jgi:outer membrane protein OmpA-like peptidoglycan-associated protein
VSEAGGKRLNLNIRLKKAEYMKLLSAIVIAAIFLPVGFSYANPTQTGVTGLINVPTADTLDSGNICVGLWGNISDTNGRRSTIIPAALTVGIGSFWEVYAAYPNLLFNNQEELSGRGTADLGTKLRILGKRSSTFKLAADIFAKRHISRNQTLDGITDIGGRLIASLQRDRMGLHLYGGYMAPGAAPGQVNDDQMLFGAGIDFSPTSRSKLLLELFGSRATDFSNRNSYPLEGSFGLQYYISPHLTVNVAGGIGFTGASPDWRAVVGFTTCQGIGTYIKPVPRVRQGPEDQEDKPKEVVKQMKIIPITSLMVKSVAATAPVSKLEIPVESDKEEIVIKPYGQVIIPPQPAQTPVVLPPLPPTIPDTVPSKPESISAVPPGLPKEVPAANSVESVKMAPKYESRSVESDTQNRIEGVTPLYGMEVKGDSVRIAPIKSAKLPEYMTVYRKFRFPDVLFEFGGMELSPDVRKSLSEVAEQIRNDKKWTYLRIDGHSDSIGSVSYNLDLSLKRAIAVATYLITTEGIDPGRVFIKGMGKSKPLSDNDTTEGRRINRRFEILFLVPKGKS